MTEPQTGSLDDHLFVTLITDLVTQAWVSLGKIKHPLTDKLERNIPAAGLVIDMLDMLNRKTAGNRSEMEDRLLLDSLQQLKINYVAEAEKPEASEEPEEPSPEAARAEADEASKAATETQKTAKKSPKKQTRPAQSTKKSSR